MALFESLHDERINTLLGAFLEQYKNFDESCSPANIGDNPVLLLFGTSKAGTSAFTARLKSGLPGAAFRNELPVSEGERKVIEEIVVGCGVNSTTVFPKISRLSSKGLLVCDMPGWRHTHVTNKAIISILHKCLFKRVSKAKMLIVVDIRKLSIAASDIAESYYSELKDLFGEHFFDFLNYNCYFVLTHGDTVEDPQAIVNTIPGKMMELLSANNAGAAQFFHRLHSAHMIINYNVTTPEMILTKVTAWMADDKYMNPQKFAHDKIVATANIINRQCVEILMERIEEENVSEFLRGVRLNVREYRDLYYNQTKDMGLSAESNQLKQLTLAYIKALSEIQAKVFGKLRYFKNIKGGVDESIKKICITAQVFKDHALDYSMIDALKEYEGHTDATISQLETVSDYVNDLLVKF